MLKKLFASRRAVGAKFGSLSVSSFYVRLILLIFPLITIPFLISSVVTYARYSGSVEQNARSYSRQIIEQVSLNLDRYVKDMERITLLPFYDNEVINVLNKHDKAYGSQVFSTADEESKMTLFLASISFDRFELRGVFIFANDSSLYSNVEGKVNRNWLGQQNEWMSQVRQAEGGLSLVPAHTASYYIGSAEQVFSVARLIKEPSTNKSLGFVKVDLTSNGMEKILAPVNLSADSRLYITDRAGNGLYPVLGQNRALPVTQADQLTLDGQEFLSSVVASDYTGLKVVGLVPVSNLRRDANELTSFTLLLSVLALVCAFGLAALLSRRLVQPIRHLQGKMKRVEQGKFEERAIVYGKDEIGQLAQGFNAMVSEIDRLVKEVYETRLRERDAELAALQSQINPHFLYNTLESMNMLALQRNHYDLSDLTTSLGKLLRYTVDTKEKLVYLREELRFVEAYLHIQSLRYGERLQHEVLVDPSLELALIPKLILQPLVENAIQHGIGNGAGVIRLSATLNEADDLVLTVEDDGTGLTAARTTEVEQHIYALAEPPRPETRASFGEARGGFALRNVHQRLRLLYGAPFGLSLDKTVATGSRFVVTMPFQLEE